MQRQRVEALADGGHGGRGLGGIDGDPDELRSGVGKCLDLSHRRGHVDRVGVGHRLHDDRRIAADLDAPDEHGARPTACDRRSIRFTHGVFGRGDVRTGK